MRRLAAFSLALILLCAPAGAATLTSSIESTALEMGRPDRLASEPVMVDILMLVSRTACTLPSVTP